MIGKSTMIFSNKGVSLCWNIDLTSWKHHLERLFTYNSTIKACKLEAYLNALVCNNR